MRRAYNRKTYDENALVRKIADRLPDSCIRSLVAESAGGKDGGAETSFTEVELSRTAFATSFLLDFTSSRAISFARGSKTHLGLFSGKRGETFRHMCVRCIYAYMRISRPQFIRDKSGEESNAISRIEFSSGAKKIWVSPGTPELANVN